VAGLLPLDTGVALHVDVSGPADGRTVVLVNGLTMSVAAWAGLTERLERDHRVVRYDMRGQGLSESPTGPHRPAQHAADLRALVRELAL
jgi:pimeloyl-ACP methyl ester carboxylesterase